MALLEYHRTNVTPDKVIGHSRQHFQQVSTAVRKIYNYKSSCFRIKSNSEEVTLVLRESKVKGYSPEWNSLGFSAEDLEKECLFHKPTIPNIFIWSVGLVVFTSILYELNTFSIIFNYFLGVRCLIPNNYFVWEATRPISDCSVCINVSSPLILPNISRQEFVPYAFSSKPIIIKKACLHWPARLYADIDDAFKSVDEECQFLHFKSDFISIRDVFSMSQKRILNDPTEKSWYYELLQYILACFIQSSNICGMVSHFSRAEDSLRGNCHPLILEEMHKHYPKPHFLPNDVEFPMKEYVFMGYDDGATMHTLLTCLMWQAQLKGSKTWFFATSSRMSKCMYTFVLFGRTRRCRITVKLEIYFVKPWLHLHPANKHNRGEYVQFYWFSPTDYLLKPMVMDIPQACHSFTKAMQTRLIRLVSWSSVSVESEILNKFLISSLDTRVWYHGTTITLGQSSLSIQSEYGKHNLADCRFLRLSNDVASSRFYQ
ncbi:hypothetical protein NQ317_003318 [Molorchus minor]|uniref:Uncharacterized protein n=1 Tax=Molorchus minor TaxID=1323400 RepID=A0ABQ9J043_9CUCU|nr:hypothetical protein NQ317_003318 [Molorchus minor]